MALERGEQGWVAVPPASVSSSFSVWVRRGSAIRSNKQTLNHHSTHSCEVYCRSGSFSGQLPSKCWLRNQAAFVLQLLHLKHKASSNPGGGDEREWEHTCALNCCRPEITHIIPTLNSLARAHAWPLLKSQGGWKVFLCAQDREGNQLWWALLRFYHIFSLPSVPSTLAPMHTAVMTPNVLNLLAGISIPIPENHL